MVPKLTLPGEETSRVESDGKRAGHGYVSGGLDEIDDIQSHDKFDRWGEWEGLRAWMSGAGRVIVSVCV